MCFAPKPPKVPPPAQFQAMQTPKDLVNPNGTAMDKLRRRGLFASIFTGPQGLTSAPNVTGTSSGVTGG